MPIYVQLADILIEQIQNLEIGSQIDSERDICEKYDVSRTTTRQALDELEKNEYIIKVHGKGNFVANKYVEQRMVEIYSFTQEMKRIGKVPKSVFVDYKLERANDKIAAKLQINQGEDVFCIKRLRLGDGIPMMLETTFLPYSRFNNLTLEVLKTSPLYDLMRKEYNINFASAEQLFRPIAINQMESKLLKVPTGMPGLKIERFTYAKDNFKNKIVEYSLVIARGDIFKYRISLENKSNI